MSQTIEAIYEHGLLKPLQALDLPEHERLSITIEQPSDLSPDEVLSLAEQVYEGFSPEEIDELEAIILDRQHFLMTVGLRGTGGGLKR
jgi:predicted DNA-binding antitoxin AbrB/MazE fold protein